MSSSTTGRPALDAVVARDHDVDHVAAEARIARRVDRLLDDRVLLLRRGQEQPDVANQVASGRLQKVDGFVDIAEGGRQIIERLSHRVLGYLLVELAQLRSALLVGLGHPLQDGLQLLLQAFDLDFDILAHALRQRVEHLRLDDLAFVHRRHREAGRRAQQGDVLCLRLRAEGFERLFLSRPELLVDGAPADLIVLAFEQSRQHDAQLIEGRQHALGKRAHAPGRQLQRLGTVRVVEVIDIGPIGRCWGLGGLRPQMRSDGGGLARCGRAEHENIEVVAFDAGAELDGLERALLADQAADWVQLSGRLEAELAGIDHPSQLRSLQRLRPRSGGRHLSTALGSRSVLLRTLEKHVNPPLDGAGRHHRRQWAARKDRWCGTATNACRVSGTAAT